VKKLWILDVKVAPYGGDFLCAGELVGEHKSAEHKLLSQGTS
jgi:hypothetical protein